MRVSRMSALLAATLPLTSLAAQTPKTAPAAPAAAPTSSMQPATNSAPLAQPIVDTVPTPRDIAWSGGTLLLDVDATDVDRRIINIKQTIPVSSSGPLTLLFPEWIPGNHAPRGQLEKLDGLKFMAGGKPVAWTRDPLNVFAFHLSVPPGASSVVATFQYLAPTDSGQSRISFTDSLINLQWFSVSLYPAGFYTRRIPIKASVTLPTGWTAATALRGTKTGSTMAYDVTDYDTLMDSPIVAGRYSRTVDLGHDVAFNIFSEDPAQLEATPEQIDKHKKLVDELVSLFGARHFDHYDYLFSISDTLGGIGVEHHRSSENGVKFGYFKKWDEAIGNRDLLAHEFTHSWNGKYRRPELLWTPDFSTPMQNYMLWLYEGQTQFWGYVLSARAGVLTKSEALDNFASIAAKLDNIKGRQWRPLDDTVHDPIISARRPKGWATWQRSEDYYNEGLMIWLEADAIIQRETKGAKGLDDFAKAFFGMNDGDWGVLTYDRKDIVDTLNGVVAYDWDGFLRDRIDKTTTEVTKVGITLGGYNLVYGDKPSAVTKASESIGKNVDQSYGVGLTVGTDGKVSGVVWDSAAFKAGFAVAESIVAINGQEYSGELWRNSLTANLDGKHPLSLIIKQDKRYRTITLDYKGGLRYPRLEKIGEGESSLDRLLKPRTGEASAN